MNTREFLIFLVLLTLMTFLVGCGAAYDAIGRIDTNGTNLRSTREHPAYCQVTKENITYFVPCTNLKHDEEI